MNSCQENVLSRLKKAEGQLRGIQKMIEDGKSCDQIMTQLSAVRSSVDRVMGMVVAENLRDCLENPDLVPEVQQAKIDKAIQLIIKK